jgi:hypothetical protein
MAAVGVDPQRILAEEIGGAGLVDVRGNRRHCVERLAEPDEALVRMHLHPEDVRIFPEADRFDGGDFHLNASASRKTPHATFRSLEEDPMRTMKSFAFALLYAAGIACAHAQAFPPARSRSWCPTRPAA